MIGNQELKSSNMVLNGMSIMVKRMLK
jgi:hypothetical protein